MDNSGQNKTDWQGSEASSAPLAGAPPLPGSWTIEGLPSPAREVGPSAQKRLLEFLTAEISNPNTRLAYARAAGRFLSWCETRDLALDRITPFAVATYVEEMRQRHAVPTVKQHLSAIRTLFDYLVVVQVLRMSRLDVFRMVKRRVRRAGLGVATKCHTFRATGITAYLLNGGSVENAQAIAAHESPRTTKLYDGTADDISLDEIERIVI